MYIFILPNLAVAYYGEVTGASQSWSLGTEEQFYIFWPLFIVIFRRRLIQGMILLLILYWMIKLGLGNIAGVDWRISNFWSLFNINCMAIGGIFAAIHFHRYKRILQILYNKILLLFIVGFLLLSLSCGIKYGFFHLEVYSVLFGIIILNLACNPSYEKILECRPLNYLGSISYGIYMYHPAIVPLAILAGKYFDSNLVIYTITLGGTFIISALSYEYFEKYFLKLKAKFA
ncbi:acyltransferase [Weeksellaceae bacterium Sa1CVA4]|uniref:Acyltransferase n=1 Tax=Kaistella pullorum TaxID=2763074 RepID=A0ABR8WJ63_9FLAO|nr:acyltransferase [Kaistella pullorum]